jgi:hypothetical protein
VQEPAYRPEFYRRLLDSKVLALVPPDPTVTRPNGDVVLRFVQWQRPDGSHVIPFFSSTTTFFQANPEGAKAVQLTTRDLFEMTRGAVLCLNPNCECCREFAPTEVESLLEKGYLHEPKDEIIKEERPVEIRTVSDPPTAMLNSLIVLYSRLPAVKGAYLISVRDPRRPEEGDILWVVIDANGDMEPIVKQTSAVAYETYPGPRSLDILKAGATGGLLGPDTFLPEQQFYDRAWGHRLMPTPPYSPS